MMTLRMEYRKLQENSFLQKLSILCMLLLPIVFFLFCQHEFYKQNTPLLLQDPQELQLDLLLNLIGLFPLLLFLLMLLHYMAFGKLYTCEFSTNMKQLIHPTLDGMRKTVLAKWLISVIITFGYALYLLLLFSIFLWFSYGLPNASYQFSNTNHLVHGGITIYHTLTTKMIYVRSYFFFASSICMSLAIPYVLSTIFRNFLVSFTLTILTISFLCINAMSGDPNIILPCALPLNRIENHFSSLALWYLFFSLFLLGLSAFLYRRHKSS